jgi:hypothetical protein
MSDLIHDEVILRSLSARIDQHLRFLDTLDKVRWSFTGAFSIGTGLAFYLTTTDKHSYSTEAAAFFVVLTLGLAAIVTQIRIFALTVVIWKRVLIIQSEEASILRKQYEMSEELVVAMHSPRVGVFGKSVIHFFTVAMVSCLAYSTIIGVTTAFFLSRFFLAGWKAVVCGVFATLGLFLLAHLATREYIAAEESTCEIAILSGSRPKR